MATATLKLTSTELQALGVHLLLLAEDENPVSEISIMEDGIIRSYQLKVNGAFLHGDGEWATYADRHRVQGSDEVIHANLKRTTISRLRALPPDLLVEWLEGAFVGDTGKILADCLERGKDDPEKQRRAAEVE